MARGVFGVARDIFEHPLFASEDREFSRLEAWLWMVREATWKQRPVVGGITLDRGQMAHSVRFMATAWGWHRARVERYLTRLRTETMIETRSETGRLIITLCNYTKWQKAALPIETATETPSEQQPRQTRKKEITSTYVEGAEGAPIDVRKELFSVGLASLRRQTGKPDAAARQMIGKWLKSTRDDAAQVLVKIRQAEADGVADAVAWVTAALREKAEYDFIWQRGA